MKSSPIRIGKAQWGTSVVLVLILGCADPVEPPSPTAVEPREVSWEDQIESVRNGTATELRTSLTPVAEPQWAMLAERCQALEVLEADASLLGPDAIDRLTHLPHLRQLILHGSIDDARIRQIAKLANLQTLNLPDAEFTNAGLQSLALLPKLELLRFRSPHVTDEGLQLIAMFPALRFLHLIDVPITDTGLAHLHGMTNLESLYLDGSLCTDDGLSALLQALPELHFHRDQLHLPNDPQAHPHESQTGAG